MTKPKKKTDKKTAGKRKSTATKSPAARTENTQAAIAAAAKSVAAKLTGSPIEPDAEPRVQGTQDQRADASRRAQECSHALDEVLNRFRCRVVPVLNPLKLVGGDQPGQPSSEGIISCTYGVVPLV